MNKPVEKNVLILDNESLLEGITKFLNYSNENPELDWILFLTPNFQKTLITHFCELTEMLSISGILMLVGPIPELERLGKKHYRKAKRWYDTRKGSYHDMHQAFIFLVSLYRAYEIHYEQNMKQS